MISVFFALGLVPCALGHKNVSSIEETQFWLQTCVEHGYSEAETSMALGKDAREVRELLDRYHPRPVPREAGRLLILPYPGGRHPRIGFLEGAKSPHRDTKFSLFLPGRDAGYVVIDFPEAVWVERDLVYLAHTHIPTVWDKQGVKLPRIDWARAQDGALESRRVLPNRVEFLARVVPAGDGADLELRLRNGSPQTITGLRAQVCVLLKGAAGFNAQTSDNKVQFPTEGVAAVRSADGKRWVATVFERGVTWEKSLCPCIHSNPSFPDLAPGQEAFARGRVFLFQGEDLRAEVERRARENTLLPRGGARAAPHSRTPTANG